ncbi:hypothetical protein ACJU26_06300 [Acidithiobacillus sp. M4-SHS-6]|uniref:hypothetical protein n=1 Tax=Acidithiobacillus sp. M4-SHS-6 TaxID=3383024 RepID=UPI0039BDA564
MEEGQVLGCLTDLCCRFGIEDASKIYSITRTRIPWCCFSRPADVLVMILQASGLFLSPSDTSHTEDAGDLPTAQFLRTIHGMNALTDAANVLIYE